MMDAGRKSAAVMRRALQQAAAAGLPLLATLRRRVARRRRSLNRGGRGPFVFWHSRRGGVGAARDLVRRAQRCPLPTAT